MSQPAPPRERPSSAGIASSRASSLSAPSRNAVPAMTAADSALSSALPEALLEEEGMPGAPERPMAGATTRPARSRPAATAGSVAGVAVPPRTPPSRAPAQAAEGAPAGEEHRKPHDPANRSAHDCAHQQQAHEPGGEDGDGDAHALEHDHEQRDQGQRRRAKRRETKRAGRGGHEKSWPRNSRKNRGNNAASPCTFAVSVDHTQVSTAFRDQSLAISPKSQNDAPKKQEAGSA